MTGFIAGSRASVGSGCRNESCRDSRPVAGRSGYYYMLPGHYYTGLLQFSLLLLKNHSLFSQNRYAHQQAAILRGTRSSILSGEGFDGCGTRRVAVSTLRNRLRMCGLSLVHCVDASGRSHCTTFSWARTKSASERGSKALKGVTSLPFLVRSCSSGVRRSSKARSMHEVVACSAVPLV
jgi:hypothetical protein